MALLVPRKGDPGPAGLSAYEVAVANGFVGTEAEWLASLEGPQGPPGSGEDPAVAIAEHNADTTGVHGIADTAALVVTTDPRLSDARTPTAHTHPQSEVVGLSTTLTDLDTRVDNLEAGGGVESHRTDTTDVHGIADTSQLALLSDPRFTDARVPLAHVHAMADITGLVTALDGKADDSDLSAHLNDATAAHAATAISFTPAGTIAATTVQAAIEEVAAEAGGGGGGDVEAHRLDTTDVHGIADTSALVLTNDARLSDARTPTAHTHAIADVTNLQTTLDGKADDGDLTAHAADTTAVHGIADTADLVLTDDARLSDARTPTAHTHAIADTTGLQTALDGKADDGDLTTHAADTTSVHGIADTSQLIVEGDARLTNARTPTAHTHAIADVTNLQTTLDGKADDADITALDARVDTLEAGATDLYDAGPLSSRPAIGSVPEDFLYAATDVGTFYIASGGAWIRMRGPGERIAYSSKSDANQGFTAAADFTNLAPITFDVQAGEEVEVRLHIRGGTGSVSNTSGALYITDNANTIMGIGNTSQANGNNAVLAATDAIERITTPGTYTRKARAQGFGGTFTATCAGEPSAARLTATVVS